MQTDKDLLDQLERARKRSNDKDNDPRWGEIARRYPGDRTFDGKPSEVANRAMEYTYFYYVGMSPRGSLRTLLYSKGGTPSLPVGDLEGWIRDAKGAASQATLREIDDVHWEGPSYLVVLIDMPNWHLLGDDGSGQNRAVYFLETISRGKPTNRNETVFEAVTVPVVVDGTTYRLAVAKNYHLKAERGANRYRERRGGDPDDHYKFDVYVRIPLEHDSDKKLTLVVDPGGRNTGP